MSLIHAEYLKLSRRKLYPIMLIFLIALAALLAFFFLIFAQRWPDLAEGVPVIPKPTAYVFGAQQVATQTWFPMILGVVILGGELASTVWATSLTREPSVVKHVLARLLVFTVAGWLGFVIGTAFWAGMAHFWAAGSGGLTISEWLDIGWRLGAVALVWTSLGLGAVALIRSVGPAIGAVIGFLFLDQILGFWVTYADISLYVATMALFGNFLEGATGSLFPGGDMGAGHAMVVIAGWTALGLALTWFGLRRRDA